MKKRFAICLLFVFIVGSMCFASSSVAQVPWEIMDQADEYGEMAFDMFHDGDFEKGLKLLHLATKTNPFDPKWHMHYSTMLSKRGIAQIKAGQRRHGKRTFRVVEKELLMATKIFLDRGDKANAANTYYQVADINRNIFRKRRTATAYYQRVLELNPGHPAAKKAMGQG